MRTVFSLAGSLAGAIVLAACTMTPAGPERPLAGSSWTAEEIAGQGVVAGSGAAVSFMADGRMAGTTGCNRFFGGYERSGQKLTFSGMGSTRMACQPELMAQEDRFLKVLNAVTGYEITADGALLLRSAGGDSLRFRPAPEK